MKAQSHRRVAGVRLLAATLFAVLCLPVCLMAQLDRGEITGTIEDPSGAVVSNAKIVLTNDATNVTATTMSTQTGSYLFGDLLPGIYTIHAEASGFEKYIVHGLYVHVQQVLTTDIHLTTGNVQQTVTVTAAAPLLEAENAQVGQTILNQEVNDLPLATRDWGSLAQMSAGVEAAAPGGVTPDAGSSEGAYYSVNGTNVWQNDYRLNGINDNIEFYGGNYTLTNAAIVPPPDAVQEFTLQSGDFNAEFGHSTGGVVNAAIKSGNNGLHGDLWEYVRNDDLNANYYFNTSNGVAKPVPDYHQNLFGVTAGGPVMIPHVINGKDRLFWFTDYQGGRYVLPEPAGGETVPTMTMINSGFTNLQDNIVGNESSTCSTSVTTGCPKDALGRTYLNGTIFDPATTRQLPASGVDPVTGLTGTPGAFVRDPFYTNCATAGPVHERQHHHQLHHLRTGGAAEYRFRGQGWTQTLSSCSGFIRRRILLPLRRAPGWSTTSPATSPSNIRTRIHGTSASTKTSTPKTTCLESLTEASFRSSFLPICPAWPWARPVAATTVCPPTPGPSVIRASSRPR